MATPRVRATVKAGAAAPCSASTCNSVHGWSGIGLGFDVPKFTYLKPQITTLYFSCRYTATTNRVQGTWKFGSVCHPGAFVLGTVEVILHFANLARAFRGRLNCLGLLEAKEGPLQLYS